MTKNKQNTKVTGNSGDGKTILKIIGINLLLVLAYSSLIFLVNTGLVPPASLGVIFIFPILQALVNIVLGIIFAVKKDTSKAMGFFISAILLPLIGFGVCIAIINSGLL